MTAVGWMRIPSVLAAATAALAVGAHAQATAPETRTFSSSAEVQALIANARKIRKPGQPTVVQHILSLEPYNANLEYRTQVGPAAVHENEVEFFYVLEGSGVLVTGGRLVDERRMNDANLSGTGIVDGQSRPVAKGDFIVVPEKTPHWFSSMSSELILMSLHAPRG